jgi:hypothetical protein
MSTAYTQRVTIAAPELLASCANQLALCLGESRVDDQTFVGADYQDADGNLYSVASTVTKPVFAQMAGQPLKAPAHTPNVDLNAATQAQALLQINNGVAAPKVIAVVLGDRLESAQDHIKALGLVRVQQDQTIT